MYISTCFPPLYVVSKIGLSTIRYFFNTSLFKYCYHDIELCFVPYFGAESEKMHILKVYIHFLYINTQRQENAPFDDTTVILPLQSEHLRTGIYQGSANCCEGDCDYDLNFLASAILGNALLQPKRVSDCPGPERDILSIAIVDIISRSALVRFSLLRARY